MPRNLAPFAAAFAVLALAACGRDRPAASAAAPDSARGGGVALLLDVPERVRAGEEVPVAATVVNHGARTVQMPPMGPDVVIAREDGAEVWRRSRHDPPRGAAAAGIGVAPGEIRGSGSAWEQRDDAGRPVPPGTYRAIAILAADGREIRSDWKRIVVDSVRP